MTNGSSQGLFVIVVVVIFGIFVVISYLLFRDKLQTSLASIFTDSTNQTTNELINNELLNYIDGSDFAVGSDVASVVRDGKEFTLYKKDTAPTIGWKENTPIGLSLGKKIDVPYGYKLMVRMELYSTKESRFYFDINARNYGADYFEGSRGTSSSDAFGTDIISDINKVIKANTWTTVSYGFVNNDKNNLKKVIISDFTSFGIRYSDLDSVDSFKIRNIEYALVEYKK